MWKNLALLGVSTLLTLAVFEFLIRREVVPLPDHMESSGWWEERWQRMHRGPVPNKFVKLDPELGWVPAPNLDRLKYQGAFLSTNSESVRGKTEYPKEKTGKTRIVAVGDSFMFGQCLSDEETIPAVLESLLPNAEVINLGVMGYGQGQMRMRLLRDGLPYDPDIVLFGFLKPDIDRNPLTFRDYGKPRYVLDDGELEVANVPVKMPEEYEAELRFPNYVGMLWDSLTPEQRELESSELGIAITRAMADDAKEAGAEYSVLYFPRWRQVELEPIPWKRLARVCEKDGLHCIGPGPRIHGALPDREERRRHFKCHFSPVVARLIAEEAAVQLQERYPNLFPGS